MDTTNSDSDDVLNVGAGIERFGGPGRILVWAICSALTVLGFGGIVVLMFALGAAQLPDLLGFLGVMVFTLAAVVLCMAPGAAIRAGGGRALQDRFPESQVFVIAFGSGSRKTLLQIVRGSGRERFAAFIRPSTVGVFRGDRLGLWCEAKGRLYEIAEVERDCVRDVSPIGESNVWLAVRPAANDASWVWLVAAVHKGRLTSLVRDHVAAVQFIRSWAGHAELRALTGPHA